MLCQKNHRTAFTLVEVAVVLAVVGLLAGGVISGQAMMKEQQIRKISTSAMSYKTAMQQFKIKYGYLAGDFPTAEAVWGNASGGAVTSDCASPNNTYSVGTATCNGNGNGVLDWVSVVPTPLVPPPHEFVRAWQHLAAAQMIEGKYKGAATSATWAMWNSAAASQTPMLKYQTSVASGVLPAGPLERSFFMWFAGPALVDNNISANSDLYDGDYTTALQFGAASGLNGAATLLYPVLTPQEQFLLDSKVDDGAPATGALRANKPTSAGFVTAASFCALGTTMAATYNTTYVPAANVASFRGACSPIFMFPQSR